MHDLAFKSMLCNFFYYSFLTFGSNGSCDESASHMVVEDTSHSSNMSPMRVDLLTLKWPLVTVAGYYDNPLHGNNNRT